MYFEKLLLYCFSFSCSPFFNTAIWMPHSLRVSLIKLIGKIQYKKYMFPRSPWSNTYDPPLEDGAMPSDRLRKLELDANQAFDQYRDMYFEGGVSSVYLWDLDHGFAGKVVWLENIARLSPPVVYMSVTL